MIEDIKWLKEKIEGELKISEVIPVESRISQSYWNGYTKALKYSLSLINKLEDCNDGN